MANYTNKTKSNNNTYQNKLGKGDSWAFGEKGFTFGQTGLMFGLFAVLTSYVNKIFHGNNILWSEATDTWDDYTQTWAGMVSGASYTNKARQATNYINKDRSSGTRGRTWDEATLTWAGYTVTWDEMTISGVGTVYTNKLRTN